MFVLIIYIYAGMLAKGDSVAMSSTDGFTTEASCMQAGKKAEGFVAGSTKEYRFICVKK